MNRFLAADQSALKRIGTAYAIEVIKAAKLKFTYLGPLLVLLTVAVMPFMPLMPKLRKDGISDYGFIAAATPPALNIVGAFMLIVFCAGLMSKEFSSGTIRNVLVRPLRRWEFLAAKVLLGMSYAALLTVLATGVGWGMVWVFGDLNGVTYGGELLHTGSEMFSAYLVGALLGLLPLFAAVTYAVFISTCTRSTGAAVGSAVGIWVLLDTIKMALRIEPYIFWTYLETPWQRFRDLCDGLDPETWLSSATLYAAVTSVVSFIAFVSAATYLLYRRDLHA